MAKGKRPAEQWYSGDWFRSVDIGKCTWATIGIWREMLDIMTNEKITGQIQGTEAEICRVVGCMPFEFHKLVKENENHLFADVTEENGIVTIRCRRLYRTYMEREASKMRMRRHRGEVKQECYSDVTPLSSTSSSTSFNNSSEKSESEKEEERLAGVLLELILERKPDYKKPNIKSWARHIGLMIRRDGRDSKKIEEVIRWCQQDDGGGRWDGWRDNILSTAKLRIQFDKLEIGMNREKGQQSATANRQGFSEGGEYVR